MVPGVTPRPSPGVGSPLSRAFVLSGSLHLCPWYVSWSLPRPLLPESDTGAAAHTSAPWPAPACCRLPGCARPSPSHKAKVPERQVRTQSALSKDH